MAWYVQTEVDGKRLVKALRGSNGQPITTKREAETARDAFMAPLTVADEAEVLESMAARLAGRKAELAKWQDQQHPPLPVTQAWLEFVASPNRPDTGGETLYQYECQWSLFTDWLKESHPEATALRDVTAEVAAEYAASARMQRYSANTYNKHRALLALVFSTVKDKARITSNPWETIRPKLLACASRRELTVDELKRVCQSASGELRVLLAIGLYSGMRLGDACTLRWCETDLTRGRMTVVPNKTARRHPDRVLHIPISPYLHRILSETPPEARGEYVMPGMAADYQKRIDAVTDKVQAHFKACGIKVHAPGTGKKGVRAVVEVGFHSLRHSFVSLCREANTPLSVVESLVGHSNPAMTRHYSHASELALNGAIAALPPMTEDAVTVETEAKAYDLGSVAAKVRVVCEHMEKKNWRECRAELLTLASEIEHGPVVSCTRIK
jgi:integrase